MARSAHSKLKAQAKDAQHRARTLKRAERRKVTRAVNAWFATIILKGQAFYATPEQQRARQFALVQLKNRQDKDREKHHTKLAPELKRTRKAKLARAAGAN